MLSKGTKLGKISETTKHFPYFLLLSENEEERLDKLDGKDVEYEKGCTAPDTIGKTVENI